MSDDHNGAGTPEPKHGTTDALMLHAARGEYPCGSCFRWWRILRSNERRRS